VRLHGFVEEVGSGRHASFAGGRDLIAFLEDVGRGHERTRSERSKQ
jgi:hypothetical protein